MIAVTDYSPVLEVHAIVAHPFLGMLLLASVAPVIPLLDDACALSGVAELFKY